MMFGRARAGAALPDQVGAAFVFSGKSAADKAECCGAPEGRRDVDRGPFPIPGDVYEKICGERARLLLTLVRWRVESANDPSRDAPAARAARRAPADRHGHEIALDVALPNGMGRH